MSFFSFSEYIILVTSTPIILTEHFTLETHFFIPLPQQTNPKVLCSRTVEYYEHP